MSQQGADAPQGPGWWQASDGRWYPPAQQQVAPPRRVGWKTWQVLALAGTALVVGIGIGAATAQDDDAENVEAAGGNTTTTEAAAGDETTTTRPVTTTTRPRTTTTRAPERGTRENPFNLGERLVSDDGVEVTVNSVNFDAADAIAAENQFNEPAPPGMRYVLINVTLTNNSDETIHTAFSLSLGMVGSANRHYDVTNAACNAVEPDRTDELTSEPSASQPAAGGSTVVLVADRVRWQYAVANLGVFGTSDRLPVILGKLGEAGWELVQVFDKSSNWLQGAEKGFVLFKRPVLDGEGPEGGWAVRVDKNGEIVVDPMASTEIVW